MPFPDFDDRGLIPPVPRNDPTSPDRSPYLATLQEVVEKLGTTPLRRMLLRNLIAYRRLLADDGYTTGIQLLDGSFVENVEAVAGREPGDIDVFSILSPPDKYIADFSLWQNYGFAYWTNEIVNRDRNKERFTLDTYAMMFDQSVQIYDILNSVTYWYGLFSHQRDTFQWKGFIVIDMNILDDEAAAATMGEE